MNDDPGSEPPDERPEPRDERPEPRISNTFTDGTAENVFQGGDVEGDLYIGTRLTRPPSPEDELDDAARRLAGEVETLWLRRSVARPAPIPVHWSSTRRPVQASPEALLRGRVPGRPVRFELEGDVTGTAATFRRLPTRQLVVLGGAGSGKTVMAVLLLLDLLKEPEPGEPVPVLLSLASWRPGTSLHRWMAERLIEDHPWLGEETGPDGRTMALRLIDRGRVLPILDGLDEISPGLHASAIKAIDGAIGDGEPVVVTCRDKEYEDAVAEGHLTRAVVVEIKPIEATMALDFLRSARVAGDRRWDPVFENLQEHPEGPVASALSTPLMLSLAAAVYAARSSDPAELLDTGRFGDPAAVEEHLLDSFVPSVYAEHHARPYGAAKAERWLAFLARRMARQGTRDLMWWRIKSPAVGLVVGLIFATGSWWVFDLLLGARGAFAALLVGAVAGLACFADPPRWPEVPADDRKAADPRSALRRSRAVAAGWATVAGIAVGVTLGLWFGVGLGATPENTGKYAAALALMCGLGTLFSTAWGSFQITRFWLAATGRLPLWPMEFLSDARERGVLRQAGLVHQFRHARLQDRLGGVTVTPRAEKAEKAEKGTGETSPGFLRFLVTPLIRLAISVAGFVLMTAMLTTSWPVTPSYVSGDRPGYRSESCGVPQCTATVTTLTWRVPARRDVSTRLRVPPSNVRVPFDGLSGLFYLNGCSAATVRIEAVADGVPLPPLRLHGLRGRHVPKARIDPDHVRVGTLSVTMRRLDSKPCTAVVDWQSPGITHAQLFDIKRRLS
ncbi:NACHT domain-containing protein [Actinomadura viridis]|uniref:NACHT domain-containing protein n=1 Tax=Actinomadura viridis TaxID=58110 RepID=UPI0036B26C68